MERVYGLLGCSEGAIRPEVFIVYGAFAVLVTVLVNWTLATLMVMLKPFTCAAILLAFIRPDLAQNFLQDDGVKHFADKSKAIVVGLVQILLRMGEQFRQKFH